MFHETIAEFLAAAVRASSGNGARSVDLRSSDRPIVPEPEFVADRLSDVAFERIKKWVSDLVKHSHAVVAVEACPTVGPVDESILNPNGVIASNRPAFVPRPTARR